MAEAEMQQRIIDILGVMHTAIKNVKLYPPNSPSITNAIEKLHTNLLELLEKQSPIIFSETEKKPLICGQPLEQKDMEKIQISTLLYIMINLGIKSIFFDRGLEKEELDIFIHYLAKSPEEIRHEGGLPRILQKSNIHHISLDERVYISMEKYQKITSDGDHSPEKDTAEKPSADKIENVEKEALRLVQDMLEENVQKRTESAKEFAELLESLPAEWQRGFIAKVSRNLIEWLTQETQATPAYQKICSYLQELADSFLRQERFIEALPILDAFHQITADVSGKSEEVREETLRAIRKLATEEHIKLLLNEFNTNKRNQQLEAHQILMDFDNVILEKLLDLIRDVSDTNERVRVINLIRNIGPRAIPAVKNRIRESAPWYYLRNLAYLMGHIGNEEHVDVLQPLLLHNHTKVRAEALKSIYQTGGGKRGELLLSVLPHADGEWRINIIEMLGKLKYTDAVPALVEILRNRSLISKDEDIAMQEKVCDALGAIGSPEAIKPLTEIYESKSFLGIGAYPVKIKYAAKRALDSIFRKLNRD